MAASKKPSANPVGKTIAKSSGAPAKRTATAPADRSKASSPPGKASGSPEARKSAGDWVGPLLSLLAGEKDFSQAFPDASNLLAKAGEEKRRLEEERQSVYAGRAQALLSFAGKRLESLRAAPGPSTSENPFEGFRIRGRILDEKDGQGLANVKIVAKDLDRKQDDVIGTAVTDWEGRYSIAYSAEDFADPDRKPEIYLEVYDDADKLLTRTSRSFIDKTAKDATLSATVSSLTLPEAQDLKARLSAGKTVELHRLELGARALGQAIGKPAAIAGGGAIAPKQTPTEGRAEGAVAGGSEAKETVLPKAQGAPKAGVPRHGQPKQDKSRVKTKPKRK